MKIQRHEAKKYYKAQVEQLYKEGLLKTDKKWLIKYYWFEFKHSFAIHQLQIFKFAVKRGINEVIMCLWSMFDYANISYY